MLSQNSSVNKIFLVGYLGTTPRRHFQANGFERLYFTLCTDELIYKNGQSIAHTEVHQLFIPANHSDLKNLELRKGTLLYVTGKIETKALADSSGARRYKTEISVMQLQQLLQPVMSL